MQCVGPSTGWRRRKFERSVVLLNWHFVHGIYSEPRLCLRITTAAYIKLENREHATP